MGPGRMDVHRFISWTQFFQPPGLDHHAAAPRSFATLATHTLLDRNPLRFIDRPRQGPALGGRLPNKKPRPWGVFGLDLGGEPVVTRAGKANQGTQRITTGARSKGEPGGSTGVTNCTSKLGKGCLGGGMAMVSAGLPPER